MLSNNTTSSSEDSHWDQDGESLLINWIELSRKEAVKHNRRAFKLKDRERVLRLLSIFVSASVFAVTSYLGVDGIADKNLNEIPIFILSILLSFINFLILNILNYLNYNTNYKQHFHYEGLYKKLVIDAMEIMALDRTLRPPQDRILAEYRERFGSLQQIAPELRS